MIPFIDDATHGRTTLIQKTQIGLTYGVDEIIAHGHVHICGHNSIMQVGMLLTTNTYYMCFIAHLHSYINPLVVYIICFHKFS